MGLWGYVVLLPKPLHQRLALSKAKQVAIVVHIYGQIAFSHLHICVYIQILNLLIKNQNPSTSTLIEAPSAPGWLPVTCRFFRSPSPTPGQGLGMLCLSERHPWMEHARPTDSSNPFQKDSVVETIKHGGCPKYLAVHLYIVCGCGDSVSG